MLHYGSMFGMVTAIIWAILGVSFAIFLIFFVSLRLMRSDHHVFGWRAVLISLLSFWLIWSTFSGNSMFGAFLFPPPKVVFNAPDGFKGPWVVLIEDANAEQRIKSGKAFPFVRATKIITINGEGVAHVQGLEHAGLNGRELAYLTIQGDGMSRQPSTTQRISDKFVAYGFGPLSALRQEAFHLKKEEFVEWALSKNTDSTTTN